MANEKYQIEVTIQGKDQVSQTIDKTNNSLKSLNQNVREVSNQGRGLGGIFGDLNSVMGQFGVGLSIAGFVGLTNQMNELGASVNAVQTTFTQVSGGTDAAAQSLSHLRQITGGVINDLDLMKGANSLLITGIASTNEQAAQLVNLGSRLGAALGQDAAESIENLNAALLNNSYARLDTLGISAARVRERVNELKEAGLDMNAAFSQAVVEIGTATLEDLGAGATVSETAISRLTTKLENLGQTLAQSVNTNLETAATTLEQIAFISDATLGTSFVSSTGVGTTTAGDIARGFDSEAMNLDVAVNFRLENAELADALPAILDAIEAGASNEELKLQFGIDDTDLTAIRDFSRALTGGSSGQADAHREIRLALADSEEAIANYNRSLNTTMGVHEDFVKSSGNVTDATAAMDKELNDLSETFQSGMRTSGGLSFFDPSQLQAVTDEAQALVDEYERLKELGESSEFTLVSQDEVERARLIAQEAESFATQAERGATAFANASLSQLAGQTGGGVLGDLTDLVLGNIEDESLRASTEQALNLASGRETDLSIALEEDIAPTIAAIADVYGEEAAVVAAQAAADAIARGVQEGLSQSEIIVAAQQATGFELVEGTGQAITVQAGDTLSGISARTGISVEDLRAANGGTNMIRAGDVINVGDGTQLIAVAGGSADLATGGIQGVDFIDPNNPLLRNASQAMGIMSADRQGEIIASTDPASQGIGTEGALGATSYEEALALEKQNETVLMTVDEIETRMSDLASDNPLAELATPFLDGLEMAGGEIDTISNSLNALQEMDFSLQMPIEAIFTGFAAEVLARNPDFVRAVNLVSVSSAGTSATGGGR